MVYGIPNVRPWAFFLYQGGQAFNCKKFDSSFFARASVKSWAAHHAKAAWELGGRLIERIYRLTATIFQMAGASMGGGSAYLATFFDRIQIFAVIYLPFSIYQMFKTLGKEELHWTQKLLDISIEIGKFIACSTLTMKGIASLFKFSEVVAPAVPFLIGISTVLTSLELVKSVRALRQTNKIHQLIVDKLDSGSFVSVEDFTDEQLRDKFGIRPDKVEEYKDRCRDLSTTIEGRARVVGDLKLRIERQKQSDTLAIVAAVIGLVASVVLLAALMMTPACPLVLPFLVTAYVGFVVGGGVSIYKFCFDRHTEFFPLIPDEIEKIELQELEQKV